MTDQATPTPAGFSKLFQDAVAWERENSRKIAATLGGLAVKSSYAKAVIAALLALLGLQGCAAHPASAGVLASPSGRAQLDCYAAALKPITGDLFDAGELVRDLVSGKASLGALLKNLEVNEQEAKELELRFQSCKVPAVPDAGTVGS